MENIISILDNMGILGDIRQRLGTSDEYDTSRDMKIKKMSARELVASQSAWQLGDESWAENIIDTYERLKKLGIK